MLGILHSKLFNFLYWVSIQGEQRVIPQIKASKLYGLPFPLPDLSKSGVKASYKKFIKLVGRILDLHLKQESATMPQEKTTISRHITVTEQQINKAVYDLYGLNNREIGVIEACELPK